MPDLSVLSALSPIVLLLLTALVVGAAGLLPVSPGDAVLLAIAAAAPRSLLASLVLVATAANMAAKSAVYLAGRRAPRAIPARHAERFARLRARLAGRPCLLRAVVLASGATGLPPFFLTTALAGALGLRLRDYLVAGGAGAALRFAALFALPRALGLGA